MGHLSQPECKRGGCRPWMRRKTERLPRAFPPLRLGGMTTEDGYCRRGGLNEQRRRPMSLLRTKECQAGHEGVKHVGVEVGAAGPTNGAQLRVYPHHDELVPVAQPCEDPGERHQSATSTTPSALRL